MPSWLQDIDIQEVSLVDKGANQHAHIPIWKRDPASTMAACPTCGVMTSSGGLCADCAGDAANDMSRLQKMLKALLGESVFEKLRQTHASLAEDDKPTTTVKEEPMTDTFDKSALPAEAQTFIADLEKRVQELQDAAAVAPVAILPEPVVPSAEDTIAKADIWKGVSPELREMFEKNEKRAADAEEMIKAERALREVREMITKVQVEYSALPGATSEELAKTLLAVPAAERPALEKVLKAASEAIRTGATFSEVGKGGTGVSGSVMDRVSAQAKSRMEKADKPLSYEKAVEQVLFADPKLYEQYLQEQGEVK